MNSTKLILEASPWLVLLCVVAGILYAFILYYREKRFKELPAWLRKSLPVLRFILVSLLAFLILEPFLRNTDNSEKKPILVFAQDNSSSVIQTADSGWYRNAYPNEVKTFLDQLSEKFEVVPYSFSGEVDQGLDFDFSGRETDISKAFAEINARLGNLNLGAVILASDGNFNKGLNPLYSISNFTVPVFAVALGDTGIGKDLGINSVFHNKIAFLGNTFPVEIVVDAEMCSNCDAKVEILSAGRVIYEERFRPNSVSFRKVVKAKITAGEPGHQKYLVRVSRVEGEVSYQNNEQYFFMEVLDNRQKILIAARAPHPDVKAIQSAISEQQGYETELVFSNDFNKNPGQYSLVVMVHLTGSEPAEKRLLDETQNAGVPVWFIAGAGTRISTLPGDITGMNVQAGQGRYSDVFPSFNPGFTLFSTGEDLQNTISTYPPLAVPFGNYQARQSTMVLMRQKVGNVRTEYPLWTFTELDNRKNSFLAGEGLWRWRLTNFQAKGNHEAFNQLVQKTIQYLSVKADRRKFRVLHKESFAETERIILEAELYNESFELVNEPDVKIDIRNEADEVFSYQFGKTANAYRLDAGHFPSGIYTYSASVVFDGKNLKDQGEFVVLPVSAEASNLSADHGLLYELAHARGGEVVYPRDLQSLASTLLNRDELKPVITSEVRLRPLVDFWWVLMLIVLLVSIEWFVRRRFGGY